MIILIEFLLIALALILSLMGYKFKKGKWLRLIAGNTFNDFPKEASDISPFIGILMYVASIFVLITAIFTLYLYLI